MQHSLRFYFSYKPIDNWFFCSITISEVYQHSYQKNLVSKQNEKILNNCAS